MVDVPVQVSIGNMAFDNRGAMDIGAQSGAQLSTETRFVDNRGAFDHAGHGAQLAAETRFVGNTRLPVGTLGSEVNNMAAPVPTRAPFPSEPS